MNKQTHNVEFVCETSVGLKYKVWFWRRTELSLNNSLNGHSEARSHKSAPRQPRK